MIERLDGPITHPEFGTQLTHRAWTFIFRPGEEPPLISISKLGVVHAEKGFVPFPGTEEREDVRDDDYLELLAASPAGKPQDIFRSDDVKRIHEQIVRRREEANELREREAAEKDERMKASKAEVKARLAARKNGDA